VRHLGRRRVDTARGVVTLAERGHGELALGAARVGFEQAVSAYWMALNPVPRAEQYQRFINWEDLKMIELFQTLGPPPPRPAAEVRTLVEQKRAPSPPSSRTRVSAGHSAACARSVATSARTGGAPSR
jgi:hypothetical protein